MNTQIWNTCITEAIRKAQLASTLIPMKEVNEIVLKLKQLKINDNEKSNNLPDCSHVLEEIVKDFNLQMGIWTLPAISNSKSAGMIKLPDGRKAQVQIVVTTEEDDFLEDQ